MDKVKVYGADWCGDTQSTLASLDRPGVAYDYVDVEKDEQASLWVKQQNDGKERKPTVKLGALGLSVPSEGELERALRDQGILKA
jgi:mycoredoxin